MLTTVITHDGYKPCIVSHLRETYVHVDANMTTIVLFFPLQFFLSLTIHAGKLSIFFCGLIIYSVVFDLKSINWTRPYVQKYSTGTLFAFFKYALFFT